MLEDRKQPRADVNAFDLNKRFHIEIYDREFSLSQIHDVSISGTGIQIHSEVPPGTPIKLVYETDSYAIAVKGMTVWSNPIPQGPDSNAVIPSYRTGIQFDPSDRNCAMLFHALKDFMQPDNGQAMQGQGWDTL